MAQCYCSTLAARDTACSVRHLPATPGSLACISAACTFASRGSIPEVVALMPAFRNV